MSDDTTHKNIEDEFHTTIDNATSILETLMSDTDNSNMQVKQLIENNAFSLDENQDELLKDAAELVVNQQQASVSLLQRKFRIGYSRAGRLVDELESLGIISGHNGSKPREVLKDRAYIDDLFNQ